LRDWLAEFRHDPTPPDWVHDMTGLLRPLSGMVVYCLLPIAVSALTSGAPGAWWLAVIAAVAGAIFAWLTYIMGASRWSVWLGVALALAPLTVLPVALVAHDWKATGTLVTAALVGGAIWAVNFFNRRSGH
jgi:hypothetical protein